MQSGLALLEQRIGPLAAVTGARNLLRRRDVCESGRGIRFGQLS